MHWRWKQSTGELFAFGSPQVGAIATGYAGAGSARNNPDYQCVEDLGPIPRGWYEIGAERDSPAPVTLPLTPDAGNDMCGRSGFLIHADSVARPGWASQGCIILGKSAREKIRDSGATRLEVVT